MVYTDAEGREWAPRVDGRVVRNLDARLERGFFAVMLDLMDDAGLGGRDVAISNQAIIGMAKTLFGKIENVIFLLYDGCKGYPRLEGRKPQVSWDDFCAAFRGKAVLDGIKTAMILLVEFFPKPDDVEMDKAAGSDFLRGLGATSMKPERSRE